MGRHQEILPQLVEICTAIDPECGVVLIGSVARGVERANSDIDLNILFPGDECVVGVHRYIAADNRWQLQVKDQIEGIRIDVAWETEQALLERVSGDGAACCWPFSQGQVLYDPLGVAARPLNIAQAWFAAHRAVAERYEAEYAAAKAEQRRRR
jgi:predicted nucleotidyltransferase